MVMHGQNIIGSMYSSSNKKLLDGYYFSGICHFFLMLLSNASFFNRKPLYASLHLHHFYFYSYMRATYVFFLGSCLIRGELVVSVLLILIYLGSSIVLGE